MKIGQDYQLRKIRAMAPSFQVSYSPMRTLVIETSSEQALLALIQDQSILAEMPLPGGPSLSAQLAKHLQQLLDLHPEPIGKIALGVGPGSYTGIRVGAALAQALCFGWKIPLCTACSLSAFAPDRPGPYAVVFDARAGGVYFQIPGSPPQKMQPEKALEHLIGIPLILSPHPEILAPRFPSLAISAAKPSPLQLLRSASPSDPRTPSLIYL